MSELVTVEQVNIALRLDLAEDDPRIPDIQAKIDQATDAVLDYIGEDPASYDPSTMPPRVQSAILLAVGSLVGDDQAKLLAGLAGNDPTNAIVGLLRRLRTPSMA